MHKQRLLAWEGGNDKKEISTMVLNQPIWRNNNRVYTNVGRDWNRV